MERPYTPISCTAHDRLLALATLRQECELTLAPAGAPADSVRGIIEDVYSRDGVEYLRLRDGRTFRLDEILALDGRPIEAACERDRETGPHCSRATRGAQNTHPFSTRPLSTPNRAIPMDEIVQQVVQRTGIPEAKARMAVQVVLSQLEKRLPAPIASQITAHLSGGGGGAGGLGDVAKGIGGMFGK